MQGTKDDGNLESLKRVAVHREPRHKRLVRIQVLVVLVGAHGVHGYGGRETSSTVANATTARNSATPRQRSGPKRPRASRSMQRGSRIHKLLQQSI